MVLSQIGDNVHRIGDHNEYGVGGVFHNSVHNCFNNTDVFVRQKNSIQLFTGLCTGTGRYYNYLGIGTILVFPFPDVDIGAVGQRSGMAYIQRLAPCPFFIYVNKYNFRRHTHVQKG